MTTRLNQRSEKILAEIHPDLAKVVRHAAETSKVDFTLTEGLRTLARQRELVAKGASKTLNSRHLTGHAVDVAALIRGKVNWSPPLYADIADAFLAASRELAIPIRWGGDWDGDGNSKDERFFDGPHFELPAKVYPADAPAPVNPARVTEAGRTLAFGDRGERVRDLQLRLAAVLQRQAEVPDGVFGTRTRGMVKDFQTLRGLPATGIADHRTLAKLKL